jgi:hypothetical protein
MKAAARNQDEKKSTGSDGHKASLYAELPEEGFELLQIIAEDSLGTGIVPACIEEAQITPVFKGGGKLRFERKSYRPV